MAEEEKAISFEDAVKKAFNRNLSGGVEEC
jgi:hypothetical protein